MIDYSITGAYHVLHNSKFIHFLLFETMYLIWRQLKAFCFWATKECETDVYKSFCPHTILFFFEQ